MSNVIFILGESGTGKTASMRNIKHKENFLIQSIKKPLPFKTKKESYIPVQKKGDFTIGNIFCSDNSMRIHSLLQEISDNRNDIKTICIDDFQYLMSNEYMRRCKENGWDKFTDIGKSCWDLLSLAMGLRDDLNIYILSHTEKNEDGSLKIKTIGKMLDEKITLEGMVTMVLYTIINDNNYLFQTQNNGRNTAKSPMGMFKEILIENDLKFVNESINDFYK